MKTITQLTQNYVQRYHEYEQQRDKIRSRIVERKRQIERLESKLTKLDHPSWIDSLVEPIAKAMVKKMPGRYYDILGPFGMGATTSIHFYKIGADEKHLLDDCKSITFRPTNLDKGELSLVDYTHETQQYTKGTMGEMNGMNYPTIPVKATIDELLAFVA